MVIGILFGGKSVEHDISILSAIQAMKSLKGSAYQVIPMYLTKDLELLVGGRYGELKTYQNKLQPKKEEYANLIHKNGRVYLSKTFRKFQKDVKIDLILPIMHGKGVEDGNISGYLEILGIPYIGTHTLGASISQDKEFTKIVLEKLNIKVLPYEIYNNTNSDLDYPLIIKPAKLGSSIGITKVTNDEEFEVAIKQASKYDSKIIVEKCLENFKEFSCASYFFKEEVIISDVEEVKLSSDIYSFIDKYQHFEKTDTSNHIIPANISKELTKEIKELTKTIYQKLELSGVVRIDYLYDLNNKQLYVNEINTIPGTLAYYLFKDQKLNELIDDLIKQCLIDVEKEKEHLQVFNSSVLINNQINKK